MLVGAHTTAACQHPFSERKHTHENESIYTDPVGNDDWPLANFLRQ